MGQQYQLTTRVAEPPTGPESLPAARFHAGRRMTLTFPLFPPPQKS
jgi:hypothetical protein